MAVSPGTFGSDAHYTTDHLFNTGEQTHGVSASRGSSAAMVASSASLTTTHLRASGPFLKPAANVENQFEVFEFTWTDLPDPEAAPYSTLLLETNTPGPLTAERLLHGVIAHVLEDANAKGAKGSPSSAEHPGNGELVGSPPTAADSSEPRPVDKQEGSGRLGEPGEGSNGIGAFQGFHGKRRWEQSVELTEQGPHCGEVAMSLPGDNYQRNVAAVGTAGNPISPWPSSPSARTESLPWQNQFAALVHLQIVAKADTRLLLHTPGPTTDRQASLLYLLPWVSRRLADLRSRVARCALVTVSFLCRGLAAQLALASTARRNPGSDSNSSSGSSSSSSSGSSGRSGSSRSRVDEASDASSKITEGCSGRADVEDGIRVTEHGEEEQMDPLVAVGALAKAAVARLLSRCTTEKRFLADAAANALTQVVQAGSPPTSGPPPFTSTSCCCCMPPPPSARRSLGVSFLGWGFAAFQERITTSSASKV
eukprot:GHVT01008815.1.p1 GENE.GHVT01008815.1~~GHVT01008815.1.p1  ORF type:complete len:481 (+),score=109.78 GHVT01008815.1:290-1732(+)